MQFNIKLHTLPYSCSSAVSVGFSLLKAANELIIRKTLGVGGLTDSVFLQKYIFTASEFTLTSLLKGAICN